MPDLNYWCTQADKVATDLYVLTDHAIYHYLESVCSQFIFTHRKNNIRNEIVRVSKLQRQIYRCLDNIMELSGMGAEWEKAEKISKDVVKVIRWLEDVLCWAMVDLRELVSMHNHKKLLYQIE